MITTGCASALTFSTVNRLRPRHLAPRQWILARITARNAQHSPLTAAAKSHLVGFKNSFPLSIQHGARPATIAEVARQSGASLASSPEVANVTGKYFYKCRSTTPSAPALHDRTALALWQR